MAAPTLRRLLALGLIACLFAGIALAPAALASEQVDDEEDVDLAQDAAKEFEAAEGGGTEVVASGEDVEEPEEEVQLGAAEGIETAAIFPAFVGKNPVFRAGQQADLLFGVSNQGSSPLKIHFVLSRLFLPYDSRVIAQNFTGEYPSNITVANVTVEQGAQASFAYHFTPFKLLQPMSFGFSSILFYEVDGTQHASLLFNSTVEILEPAGMVSGETVFLVLLGAGLLTLFGMWASTQLQAMSKRAKKGKKVETGTKDDVANNEWLQGTFFTQGKEVKQRKAKR